METVGPASFGPGMITSNGCDFRTSLSWGVAARITDTNQLLRTQAVDLATQKSEFGDAHPIDMYKLFVQKATYRNKVTGLIETKNTLVDETFHEPLSIWTDAGENKTGSPQEYLSILARTEQFANTQGNATMFWVSPGAEKRKDGLPQHRAYLWRKDGNEEVTAFSYQLAGTEDTLSQTLFYLSKEATIVDVQTLLWNNPTVTVTHNTIFNAYKTSLTDAQRVGVNGFLDRFRQEADQSDELRWQRREADIEESEKQLQKAYKGDIQAAVESLAQGFISSVATVHFQIGQNKPFLPAEIAVRQVIKSTHSENRQKDVEKVLIPTVPVLLFLLSEIIIPVSEIPPYLPSSVPQKIEETTGADTTLLETPIFIEQTVTPLIPAFLGISELLAITPPDIEDRPSEQSDDMWISEFLKPSVLIRKKSSNLCFGVHPVVIPTDSTIVREWMVPPSGGIPLKREIFHDRKSEDPSAEFILSEVEGLGMTERHLAALLRGNSLEINTSFISEPQEIKDKNIEELLDVFSFIFHFKEDFDYNRTGLLKQDEKEYLHVDQDAVIDSIKRLIDMYIQMDNSEVEIPQEIIHLTFYLSVYEHEDTIPEIKTILAVLMILETKQFGGLKRNSILTQQLDDFIHKLEFVMKESPQFCQSIYQVLWYLLVLRSFVKLPDLVKQRESKVGDLYGYWFERLQNRISSYSYHLCTKTGIIFQYFEPIFISKTACLNGLLVTQ